MLTETLIRDLRCPECHDALSIDVQREDRTLDHTLAIDGRLTCAACKVYYPVAGGIADLIPYSLLKGARWETWKAHLEGFRSRRERMTACPQRIPERWSRTHAAFLDFARLPRGRVLDIGCGPGGLRRRLDPDQNPYVGIDPLPAAELKDIPFVQAIAERLPFASDSFTSLIVSSALDHFCDLGQFFAEARRVLVPGGKLFIQQSVHGAGGVTDAVRMLVHRAKDSLDNLRTARVRNGAPKHITEFDRSSLSAVSGVYFEVHSAESFNASWYSPTKMFVALCPKEENSVAAC